MRGLNVRIARNALWLLLALGALHAEPALAQSAPDMREIFPYLTLVIDTSGSMERLPACSCSTPGCEECLPSCTTGNFQKNRWAVTLEALTGSFNNFQCTELARIGAPFSFDAGYYLPYHQPWHCATVGTPCDYNATGSTLAQQEDGILDEYKGRVSFGLMTFDGFDTWVGAPPLVPVNTFQANTTLANGEQGLWSYGGGKRFHYPNCTTDYMMDTGARSGDATQGTMVSIDSCKASTDPTVNNTCPDFLCHGTCWNNEPSEIVNQLNDDIQGALLSARPYGGTPIAASLDDLYTHFSTEDDKFAGCRNRFALLMTDGYPDDDYRAFGCDCKNEGDPLDPNRCGPPPLNNPDDMACPYPKPEDAAFKLVHGQGTAKAMIEQLFVVGLAVDDQTVLQRLDAIADSGCPYANGCDTDGDGHEALFANDIGTLVSSLSTIIQGFLHPISRSVPVFAGGTTDGVEQYQISTGFEVPIEKNAPWTGVIERRRFLCSGTGDLLEEPIAGEDLLHNTINAQDATSLNLITTLPSQGFSQDGPVYGKTTGTPCGLAGTGEVSGCTMTPLDGSTVGNLTLGLGATDDAKRIEVMDWMKGINGSTREGRRLGDIYHSSPVILTVPRYDTGDEAFNEFRQRPVVIQRPLTMFVGTNDGILHAISIEKFTPLAGSVDYTGTGYDAGQQMWGFVPPMMLRRLKDNLTDHHLSMDGTPVVKNVYFSRVPGAVAASNADQYHTVLITGMRGGGNGYIALDVTNPTIPKFLWQYTDADMGKTYAQPAIAQAVFQAGGTVKNGAIAILSGGVGTSGPSGVTGDCTNGATNPSMKEASGADFTSFSDFDSHAVPPVPPTPDIRFRTDMRCWRSTGRALYFIDVETGELIKKIFRDSTGKFIFPSPIVSTPSIFQSDIGTRASRAFVTDADGVIWRIDLTATVPDSDPMLGWTARPFHDLFWGRSPTQGELSYEAPVLSVDDLGRVVVIVGTGDTDNFTKSAVENRVVSLTEVIDPTTTHPYPEGFRAALNWEKRVKPSGGLVASELVTGSMGLFARQLFFGTFIGITSTTNFCEQGAGRVHAVDFIARDTSDANGSSPETYGPKLLDAAGDADADSLINKTPSEAISNLMIMGLGVTQRPSCELAQPSVTDPWGKQSVPAPSQVAEPALYLVAQGSGDTGQLLQANAGGRLLNVQLKINRPKTPARVVSWATSVD